MCKPCPIDGFRAFSFLFFLFRNNRIKSLRVVSRLREFNAIFPFFSPNIWLHFKKEREKMNNNISLIKKYNSESRIMLRILTKFRTETKWLLVLITQLVGPTRWWYAHRWCKHYSCICVSIGCSIFKRSLSRKTNYINISRWIVTYRNNRSSNWISNEIDPFFPFLNRSIMYPVLAGWFSPTLSSIPFIGGREEGGGKDVKITRLAGRADTPSCISSN